MTRVPSLKMGVPSFYIWTFREGFRTGLSCQTGVAKHQVILVSQPFVSIGIFDLFSGLVFEMIGTYLTPNSRLSMVLGPFLHFFCKKSFSDRSVPIFSSLLFLVIYTLDRNKTR